MYQYVTIDIYVIGINIYLTKLLNFEYLSVVTPCLQRTSLVSKMGKLHQN